MSHQYTTKTNFCILLIMSSCIQYAPAQTIKESLDFKNIKDRIIILPTQKQNETFRIEPKSFAGQDSPIVLNSNNADLILTEIVYKKKIELLNKKIELLEERIRELERTSKK